MSPFEKQGFDLPKGSGLDSPYGDDSITTNPRPWTGMTSEEQLIRKLIDKRQEGLHVLIALYSEETDPSKKQAFHDIIGFISSDIEAFNLQLQRMGVKP